MTNSTAITEISPLEGMRQVLEKSAPAIKAALPAHVTVDKFIRVTVTAVTNAKDLLQCDRQSLYNAVMKCAQDGLLPDGREAALVKFKDQVAYMPMIAGILKKVRNSGEIKSISSAVVYSKDKFDYALGDDEHIIHTPSLEADRGHPIVTYAIVITKDGGIYREVMTEAQVQAVRNVSRAGTSGPWSGPFADEMRRKTVLRRLSKRLPMSTDIEQLMHTDDDLFMPPTPTQATEPVVEPAPEKPKGQASRMRGKVVGNAPVDAEMVKPEAAPPEPPPQQETPPSFSDDVL